MRSRTKVLGAKARCPGRTLVNKRGIDPTGANREER